MPGNSDFYQSIAQFYHLIFPVKNDKIDFITKQLAAKKNLSLLDVGCATGELAIKLSDDHQVTGIDTSPTMIEIAKSQSVGKKTVDFQLADMLQLPIVFKNVSFDGIICIGNTLAHLQNEKEVLSFLESAFSLLTVNGSLIIQIVNFDKFIKNNMSELPEIDTSEIKFTRKYHYLDCGKISFETELTLKSNDEVLKNNEILVPLRYSNLIRSLEQTGFKVSQVSGSFKGEKFTNNSGALIILARK